MYVHARVRAFPPGLVPNANEPDSSRAVCSQARGGAHHVGRLPGQGPDGVHHLPAVAGHGDVHTGSSLRHRATALLRPQEHLRPSCVSVAQGPA